MLLCGIRGIVDKNMSYENSWVMCCTCKEEKATKSVGHCEMPKSLIVRKDQNVRLSNRLATTTLKLADRLPLLLP